MSWFGGGSASGDEKGHDDAYASTAVDRYAEEALDMTGAGGDTFSTDPFAEDELEEGGGLEFVPMGGASTDMYAGLGGASSERAGMDDDVDAAAVFGVSGAAARAVAQIGQSQSGGGYLNPSGTRSIFEIISHNVGGTYLAAGCSAGMFGFASGIATARSYRPRILLNSVLNSVTRHGSRAGNTAGIISLVYSMSVWSLDQLEFDRVPPQLGIPRRDIYTPIAAGGIAGFLFRAPAIRATRPVTIATALLSGVLGSGAVATTAIVGPKLIGSYSPFEW